MPAPVAMFVFNRPLHTQKTLEALKLNRLAAETELFVFCDGPRSSAEKEKTDAVRALVKKAHGFKSVTVCESDKNRGLSASITGGITSVLEKHSTVIVLEDDLITAPEFLEFMNAALEKYNGDSNVYSISGFSHSNDIEVPSTTYFLNLTSSWGWATWADKWRTFSRSNDMLCRIINDSGLRHRFDFDDSSDYAAMAQRQMDGHSDSWAIYWYASVFLRGGLTLYPARSLVKNTGFDGSGRHCGAGGEELQLKPFSYSLADNIEENHSIRALLVENKRKSRPGFLKKLLGNLKNKAKDWLPAGARFIVMRIAARIKLFFIKKNVGKNTFIDRTVNVYGWEHVRIGDNTLIGEFSWLNVNNRKKGVFHISIGNYCYFGRRNLFTSGREMIFGDYVMTSNDCRFLGNNHVFADPMHPYVATGTTDSGVQKIGHNVWLGAGVTVLGSLEIGHGSVIGAGSVVTGTIPPFSVAVGNPCRVIKRFDFRNRCWLDIDEFVRHPELESLMPSAAEYLQLLQKNHPQIDMPKFAATSRFGDLP